MDRPARLARLRCVIAFVLGLTILISTSVSQVIALIAVALVLAPRRDPLLRIPPFQLVARAHQDLTRWLTRRFVAVRQEEHRMFLEKATARP